MSEDVRRGVLHCFNEDRSQTVAGIVSATDLSADAVRRALDKLKLEGMVDTVGRSGWVWLAGSVPVGDNPLIPNGEIFLDHAGVVSRLRHAYRHKLNVLLIGPSGIGKTASVRKMAELEQVPMLTTNFSLRTREHHFVGRLDTNPDGTLYFKKGPLIIAMENGYVYYLDELNTAEGDCLVKLDSALDYRRSMDVEGEHVVAHEDFWACATVNPLDRYHPGTKELPGQILSRFPVRIFMDYPDASTEYNIVKLHVPDVGSIADKFMPYIFAMRQMRESPDLPYHPSLRESITLAKLLTGGVSDAQALRLVLVDVMGQWGPGAVSSVCELLSSRFEDLKFEDLIQPKPKLEDGGTRNPFQGLYFTPPKVRGKVITIPAMTAAESAALRKKVQELMSGRFKESKP